MPSFRAAFFAVGSEREAIARTSISLLFSMPGMTFSVPILAVEIMPQRTGPFLPLLRFTLLPCLKTPRRIGAARPRRRSGNRFRGEMASAMAQKSCRTGSAEGRSP